MQKGCKRVRTCESKFEWEIRDYASGVQLVCLNSAKTKPGMGDPYWYEWSVGQQYFIDMLNPDNNIKCVELQANVKLGLDDVVVTYEGGENGIR